MPREYPEYDGGDYETCQVCKRLTHDHNMYDYITTGGAHMRVCDPCLPEMPPAKEGYHMTSHQEISTWFDRGVKQKASHMIIMCDDFDHEDYPVYFTGTPDGAKAKEKELNQKNMQRSMEVYLLTSPKDLQMSHKRAYNYSAADIYQNLLTPIPPSLVTLKLTPIQIETILKMLRDCRRSDYNPSTLNEVENLIKILKEIR